MTLPLTIITINLNNAIGLDRTINSVIRNRDYISQYIVIDGCSIDNSATIINTYESYIDLIIIEKDSGIYNAMNKGIDRATSKYVLFVNSGDELTPMKYNKAILNIINKNYDIIYGDLYTKENFLSTPKNIISYPEKLSFSFFLYKSLGHPSTLIKRELFLKYGKYREDFQIISDWEFFVRVVCLKQVSYKYCPIVMATFYLDGLSASDSHKKVIQRERSQVLNESFKAFIDDYEEYKYLQNRQVKLPNELIDIVNSKYSMKVIKWISIILSYLFNRKKTNN